MADDRKKRNALKDALARQLRALDVDTYGNPNLRAARDIWRGSDAGDKAAIATAPIPGVGDAVGLGNDMRHWYADNVSPGGDDWTASDYALTGAGILPFVPAGAALRKLRQPPKYRPVGHEPEFMVQEADRILEAVHAGDMTPREGALAAVENYSKARKTPGYDVETTIGDNYIESFPGVDEDYFDDLWGYADKGPDAVRQRYNDLVGGARSAGAADRYGSSISRARKSRRDVLGYGGAAAGLGIAAGTQDRWAGDGAPAFAPAPTGEGILSQQLGTPRPLTEEEIRRLYGRR